jgi:FixJ family two-component response regulator
MDRYQPRLGASPNIALSLMTRASSSPTFLGALSLFGTSTSARPPRIAVIDDDEALCASLVDLIRSYGYRADAFTSADAFLSSNIADLRCIVADIQMPGIDGLALSRRLVDECIKVPMILITALADGRLDQEAQSVGAIALLRKPFDSSRLLHLIARSIANDSGEY